MENCWDLYDIIEHTIDHAFKGRFMLEKAMFILSSNSCHGDEDSVGLIVSLNDALHIAHQGR